MDDSVLTFEFDDESRTLFVTGSVDELSGVPLREAIGKYSDGHKEDLAVDLGEVDLLPSAGVGVLAVAMRQAEENGATIELVAKRDTIVQRVLNICGLPFRER
ncbi:STAS domain-containing protein [Nocardioides panacisoli]|uniref:STAS domain-containing protein n=1 Tax=Nocardioides panacisoli TaxID=627624 RepID=A0ABP7IC73_9ACTN